MFLVHLPMAQCFVFVPLRSAQASKQNHETRKIPALPFCKCGGKRHIIPEQKSFKNNHSENSTPARINSEWLCLPTKKSLHGEKTRKYANVIVKSRYNEILFLHGGAAKCIFGKDTLLPPGVYSVAPLAFGVIDAYWTEEEEDVCRWPQVPYSFSSFSSLFVAVQMRRGNLLRNRDERRRTFFFELSYHGGASSTRVVSLFQIWHRKETSRPNTTFTFIRSSGISWRWLAECIHPFSASG